MSPILQFTIPGIPRTHKNSSIIDTRGRKIKKLPSKAYREWNKQAQMHMAKLRAGWHLDTGCYDFVPFTVRVNCCALFYRDALRGDACGFYQAIADALQEAEIVKNDALIVSWDGSRILKDAINPRIEVALTPVDY